MHKQIIAYALQVLGALSFVVFGFLLATPVGFACMAVAGVTFGLALEREVSPSAAQAPAEGADA